VSFRLPARLTRPSSAEVPSSPAGGAAAALRQPAGLVLMALLLVALLAGTVAWSTQGKTVSLAVDGEVSEVSFRGDTVADALAAAEVTVDENDALVPSADTPVEDGDSVALRRGRPLELVVDGEPRTVWVTALDVDEALQQLDLREEGLFLSASRSRSIPLNGLALEVRTPKALAIAIDGQELSRTSAAATVGEALEEARIELRELDRVTPAVEEPVSEGLRVLVQRVTVGESTSDSPIGFGTERRDDATLTRGQTTQLQAGQNGTLRRTVRLTHVDGVLESSDVVSEQQVAAPVARVLAVGTKAPAPAPAPAAAPAPRAAAPAPAPAAPRAAAPAPPRQSGGGADGLNWAALARCESGGNPSIVSSTGKYHGLYQFSQATWNSVGGSGSPSAASPAEQTARAKMLYSRSGAGQWPSCGKNLFS
jgi:resuscitation-promoting factor RpfB